MIAASAAWFAGSLFGLLPETSLRTIASVAVAGCLLTAIGYWET